MWRSQAFFLSRWFYCFCYLFSVSLALSTRLGDGPASYTSNGRLHTTRFGMPTAETTRIPRHNHRPKPSNKVLVDCHCGRVRVLVPHSDIRVDPPPPPLPEKTEPTYHAVVDCHCPSCRKYHVADRATYLHVPSDKVEFQRYVWQGEKPVLGLTVTGIDQLLTIQQENDPSFFLRTVHDSCRQLGPVIRYQCAHCSTKLATLPQLPGTTDEKQQSQHQQQQQQLLINLAAARDDTLPRKWTKKWRAFRFPWQYANQCVWTRARAEGEYPEYDDDDDDEDSEPEEQGDAHSSSNIPQPHVVTGSCSCQTYPYKITYPSVDLASTELQHCYCQLCRRLSGGPFQTWMPVSRQHFAWIDHEPPIQRYTDHGRRHVCDSCGGVLTIVYDSDGDEVIWPAAGGLDDDSLPASKEEMSRHLYGVCHICCRYRQSWYALPNDGYPHISEAS